MREEKFMMGKMTGREKIFKKSEKALSAIVFNTKY